MCIVLKLAQNIKGVFNIMEKFIIILNNVFRIIIAGLIGIFTLIITANVISRYVFSHSLTWSAEAVSYLMVWAALLGVVILVNRGENLAVNAFVGSIKGKGSYILRLFISLTSLFFFIILTFYGALLVLQTKGQVVSSMRFLPMSLIYLIIPLSGSLMILGEIVQSIRICYEWRGEAK